MPAALLRTLEGEADAKILIATLDAVDTRLLHQQRRRYCYEAVGNKRLRAGEREAGKGHV